MPRISSSPRTRILNFRLTPREYEVVQAACARQGGQCLSEFTRAAVLHVAKSLNKGDGDSPLHDYLTRLNDTVTRLDCNLDHLLEVLAARK